VTDSLRLTTTVEHVEKPWGFEEIFAVVEGSYCGKLLHVRQGEELSLQFHRQKEETIAVISGEVEVDLGPHAGDLHTVVMTTGDAVHVRTGMLHRIRALHDAVLVEVSTAAAGWRDDLVRLEDRYGRVGTNAP
jgi:mannose-6-phosphate isomerase-like protein (cupin superfamily)